MGPAGSPPASGFNSEEFLKMLHVHVLAEFLRVLEDFNM
jgi:hypothetical protein